MWRRFTAVVVAVILSAGGLSPGQAEAGDELDEPLLLFTTDRDGNDEVYVVAASGGTPTNLTQNPASDTSPSWSPDGSMVAFVSDRDGNPDIWVMDADGSNAGNVTTSPDHESDPVWSPDGTRIAYTASLTVEQLDGSFMDVLKPSIFAFDLRMGDRIRLTEPDPSPPWGGDDASDATDSQPSWSPDGDDVAFVRAYTGPTPTARMAALFTVASEGEGTPHFVAPGGWDVDGLDWSTDDQWMVWGEVGPHNVWAGLRRLHLPSGSRDDLAIPLAFTHMVEPALSFDGETVAFSAHTLNKDLAYIYTWRLDRSEPARRVTADPGWDTDPTWQSWYPPVGLVDTATGWWMLRQAGSVLSFFYGNPGDLPFMGDWDCDGTETPGLYRSSDGYVYLRNSNTQGVADIQFFFGDPGDVPIAGDFNGDSCDTVSVYRPSEARFYIVNELGAGDAGLGEAEYSFLFGDMGDQPVVGDWDSDGVDDIGLHREATGYFYYRNTLTTGTADGQFYFGDPSDRFVAGDWGGKPAQDTPAVFRPDDTTFYVRDTLSQGNADFQFTWAGASPSWIPVAGAFALD